VINPRHTRGNRVERTEDFRVHILGEHTPVSQPLVIQRPLPREVFAELTESKIVAAQEALPVMVRIHRVDKYGMVESALVRVATIISINRATQAGLERNPTASKDPPTNSTPTRNKPSDGETELWP